MKKVAKRIIGITLALACLLVYIPQSYAAQIPTLPSDFFLTQNVSGTCTLCSAAMMIRSSIYRHGNSNWAKVTENGLRSDGWLSGAGLRWSFSHTVGNTTVQVGHQKVSGVTVQELKNILLEHPEGIVLYCAKVPHAVFLTGFDGDTFYCADTVEGISGQQIMLSLSWLGIKYGSQAAVLKNVTAYWYVADYIVDGHSLNCECTDTYAGTYVSTSASTQLRIRAGHGTNYAILSTIPYGAEVTVLKASGQGDSDWAHVIYDGVIGYASMQYLEKIGDPGTVTTDVLYIRAGAGTTYTVLGYLQRGTRVDILETKQVGTMLWGRTCHGWISMSYVKMDEAEPEPEPTPQGQMGTVTTDILNIRANAGTEYTALGCLERGARVEILETKQVGTVLWGRIDKGWISMAYVQLDGATSEPEPTPQSQMGTVTTDILNIRANAGTGYTALGCLHRGTRVEILETKQVGTTLWGRIDKGWISMDYVQLDGANAEPETIIGTINTYCLRIRNGAGTTAAVVGCYYSGTQVEILETTVVNGVTWGRTDKGWISMEYVS